MFCSKPETARNDDVKFCTGYENGSVQVKTGRAKKSFRTTWLVFLLAVVMGSNSLFFQKVLAAEVTSYVSTPKEQFLFAQGRFFSSLQPSPNESNIFTSLAEKSGKTAYTSKSDISFSFDNAKTFPYSAILSKLLIQETSKNDPKTDAHESKVSLKYEGKNLIDASLILNTKEIGVSIPALYDKLLYIKTDKLKEFAESYGVTGFPTAFPSASDSQKLVNSLNLPKYMGFLKSYGKIIADNMDEKDFTIQKDSSFTKDDITIKTKDFTYALNQKGLLKISKAVCEKALNDTALIDAFYKDIKTLDAYYKSLGQDIGLSQYTDKSEFENGYKQAFEEIILGLDSTDIDDSEEAILFTVSLDSKGNFISNNIRSTDETLYLAYSDFKTDESRRNIIEGNFDADEEESLFSFYIDTKYTDADEAGTINSDFNFSVLDADTDYEFDGTVSMDYTADQATMKFDSVFNQGGSLLANIASEYKLAKKNNVYDEDLSLQMALNQKALTGSGEPINIGLRIKSSYDYSGNVTFTEIKPESSVNIATLSQEELTALQEELAQKAQALSMKIYLEHFSK